MLKKEIHFSEHAGLKFEILSKHGIKLDQKMIMAILEKPELTADGYSGRKIAQGSLDENHILRVVYEEKAEEILVVTFYPGKRERYG
jgi:hypothetical protein